MMRSNNFDDIFDVLGRIVGVKGISCQYALGIDSDDVTA